MRGSIRKRGSTHTAYWFTIDPSSGKRRQHSKGGFATKGAAEAQLNAVVGKVEAGNWTPDSRATIKEFVEKAWLPSLRAAVAGGSIKPATEKFYEHLATRHIVAHLGAVKLAALTSVRLNTFYAELLTTGRKRGKGLSPTTVASVHVTTHRMLKDAVKWGHLQRNVADHATPPRPATNKMAPWSPSDTRRFIEATEGQRLGALWRLAAMTGLRRGEVCGLQWADVDLDARRLNVERARVMAGGQVVISTPKTATSARSVGLDPQAVLALRSYKARHSAERLAAGEAWAKGEEWVFTDEVGRPLHPTKLSKLFTEAAAAAGLPRIRLHDLRHGYATAALEAGAPLKVVSERLGHKSVGITADTYSHVRPEVDQAVADKVAALIMSSDAR